MNVFQQHLGLLLQQTGQQDRNAYTQLMHLTAPSICQRLYTYYKDTATICQLLTVTYLNLWQQSASPHMQAHPLQTIVAHLHQAGTKNMDNHWAACKQSLSDLANHFSYDQAFLALERMADIDYFSQQQQYLSYLTAQQQDIYFLAGMEHFHMPVLAKIYCLSMQEMQQEFITALTTVQIHRILAAMTTTAQNGDN